MPGRHEHPARGRPPPHRHDFEESFTILEGEIEATFRGEKIVVHAQETINIPSKAPHSFTNASQEMTRLHCLCAPAGQNEFFAEVGLPGATRTTPPPKLDEAARIEPKEKTQSLLPKYRTEMFE